MQVMLIVKMYLFLIKPNLIKIMSINLKLYKYNILSVLELFNTSMKIVINTL
ncbi:hypothetical protein N483_23505 [Pseudoalteromonas luteoviolacea NCIMB 1944]|nr:hypothetical protein N483_23505 [Pseudoalteromonas luteoviolacea NCIMB 1944]